MTVAPSKGPAHQEGFLLTTARATQMGMAVVLPSIFSLYRILSQPFCAPSTYLALLQAGDNKGPFMQLET